MVFYQRWVISCVYYARNNFFCFKYGTYRKNRKKESQRGISCCLWRKVPSLLSNLNTGEGHTVYNNRINVVIIIIFAILDVIIIMVIITVIIIFQRKHLFAVAGSHIQLVSTLQRPQLAGSPVVKGSQKPSKSPESPLPPSNCTLEMKKKDSEFENIKVERGNS